MKIIIPRTFNPAMITTNVPISETLWVEGAHTIGQRRYVLPSYDLYEVVVAATDDDPITGAARDVKTWAKVGKVNAFACFDNVLQNPTVVANGLDITFAPGGEVNNGIAFLNVIANSIRITVTDSVDGQGYDQTLNLVDNSNLSDWPDLHFAPVIRRADVVVVDLPFYLNASVRIRIEGAASIGEVILGPVISLGHTRWDPTVGIIDRSKKETDVFGGVQIIERGFSKRANLTVNIQTSQIDHVFNTLTQRRAKPTLYIGSIDFSSLILFGFFLDMTPSITGPKSSQYVIELEGLV